MKEDNAKQKSLIIMSARDFVSAPIKLDKNWTTVRLLKMSI